MSIATQNDVDGHDTEARLRRECRCWSGALHELPLKVNARPYRSTATQNDADGHDTDVSNRRSSMGVRRSTSCR